MILSQLASCGLALRNDYSPHKGREEEQAKMTAKLKKKFKDPENLKNKDTQSAKEKKWYHRNKFIQWIIRP